MISVTHQTPHIYLSTSKWSSLGDVSVWLGCLLGDVFWVCPTRKRHWGRPRTCWRDYVSWLAWECFGLPLLFCSVCCHGWLDRWRKTQYSIISNKHTAWLLCTSQVKYFQAWPAGRRLQGGPRTCRRCYFSQLAWEHICFSQKSWRRWMGKERFRLLCL